MVRRTGRFVWYLALLGLAVLVFEKITGGITGGLKKGAASAIGL